MADTAIDPLDKGLFSNVIDYDAEEALIEEKNKKLADSQKRIARTNAIGDAFRLLIDGVGGSAGATITPKAVNPGIISATSKLTALEKEKEAKLERLKMMDITNKTRDLQRTQQLGDKKADQEYNDGVRSEAELNAYNRMGKQQEYNEQNAKTNFENTKALDDHRTNNQLKEIEARIAAQAKTYTKKRSDRYSKLYEDDIEFITPDTKKTIYLGQSEITLMLHELTKGKNKYDPELEPALKSVLANGAIKDKSTMIVLMRNWNTIKYLVPELDGEERQVGPTPEEVRKAEYEKSLLDAAKTLEGRALRIKIKSINEEYKSGTPTQAAQPQTSIIAPDENGVTNVENIFAN